MGKHKVLILAAVMIAAATTAYGYTEEWTAGWFSGGTFTYNSTVYTFDHVNAELGSYIYAWTYDANIDSITGAYIGEHKVIFYNSAKTDSLIISLVDYSTYKKLLGKKYTGQSGTKEGSGTWTAECTNKSFYLRGTWNTGDDEDTKYFDYGETPPVGNGNWTMTWTSSMLCTSGSGVWQTVRTAYRP